MAGKGEKICIQRLYVDRHMRNALGAVHNDNGSHAVRHLRDFLDRIHAAAHIRYLPRKQIAVMLHDCYSDLVAFL